MMEYRATTQGDRERALLPTTGEYYIRVWHNSTEGTALVAEGCFYYTKAAAQRRYYELMYRPGEAVVTRVGEES